MHEAAAAPATPQPVEMRGAMGQGRAKNTPIEGWAKDRQAHDEPKILLVDVKSWAQVDSVN